MSPANALSLSFRTNLDGSPEFPGDHDQRRQLPRASTSSRRTRPAQRDRGATGVLSTRRRRRHDRRVAGSIAANGPAPASPADATTVYVSLWQVNCVGLRAERFVTWQARNANAVKYLTATAYPRRSAAETPARRPPRGRERKASKPPMRVLGYELRDHESGEPPLRPVSPGRDGWWPIVVREPYTGAWQLNTRSAPRIGPVESGRLRLRHAASRPDIGKLPLNLVKQTPPRSGREPSNRRVFAGPARTRTATRPVASSSSNGSISKLIHGNTYVLKERDARGVVVASTCSTRRT